MDIIIGNQIVEEDIEAFANFFSRGRNGIQHNIQTSFWASEETFDDPGNGAMEIISCVEDVMTFRFWASIELHPEWKNCIFSGEDKEVHIRGLFLAYKYDEETGKATILSNADNAGICIGLSQIMVNTIASMQGDTSQRQLSAVHMHYLMRATEDLERMAETEQIEQEQCGQPVHPVPDPSGLKETLFQDGTAAVVCSSKEEYEDFKSWLSGHGYQMESSIDPRCWDVFSRYIMWRPGTNMVYAYHRVTSGGDCILPPADIMGAKKEG